MDGGLEQLVKLGGPEEEETGGLPSGNADYSSAIFRLRQSARGLNPDAIDAYAQRANGAFPTWKEIQERIERELQNQQSEGAASVSSLQNPPINRGLPMLRAAAGLMSPTHTGSIGESAGLGMAGFAKGMEDQNKSELDFSRRAAEQRYGIAKDRTVATEGMFKMGQTAQQLDMAVGLLRNKLGSQMLTPAIKEWAMVNNVPLQDIVENRVPDEKRASLQQFINLARGSSQMKNAQAMLDPRDPNFSSTVRLLSNQKLVSDLMQLAEKHHPMTAYQGQDLSVRNAAVQQEFWNLVRANSLGATAGAPLPAAGPAAAPSSAVTPTALPPAAAAVPAGGASAVQPAPMVPAPEERVPHPFDDFMAPPKQQANVPGRLPSDQQEAGQKTAAEQAERRASKYIESDVQPGIKAADDMRTSAIVAKQLLAKDPNLTGAGKQFFGEIANWMTTLGVAPARAQQFATNIELFRSQAMLQVLAKQLDQKGVQTESDALRIMQAGIDPKKPADANRFMIRYMEASANRMQERAAFFDRWAKVNGGQLAGSVEAWNAYSKKFPMAMVEDGKVHFRDVPLPQ